MSKDQSDSCLLPPAKRACAARTESCSDSEAECPVRGYGFNDPDAHDPDDKANVVQATLQALLTRILQTDDTLRPGTDDDPRTIRQLSISQAALQASICVIYKVGDCIVHLQLHWELHDKPEVTRVSLEEGITHLTLEGDALAAATEWLVAERRGDFVTLGTNIRENDWDDRLVAFNEHHFMCNDGQSYATIKSDGSLLVSSKQSFMNLYEHLPKVSIPRGKGTDLRAFYKFWFEHPLKRVHDSVECIPPPLTCPTGTYNTWTGFEADRLKDTQIYDEALLEPVLQHFSVLCSHDAICTKYVIDWVAQIIQQPGRLSQVCIATIGDQGCGKNTITSWLIESIIGTEFALSTCNAKAVLGDFNHMVANLLFLNLDEVKTDDGYMFSEQMKTLITESVKTVTRKGVNSRLARDCTRIWATSNARNPIKVPAGEAERRFVVIKASNEKCGDTQYFNELHASLDNPAVQWTFIEFLRHRDISGIHWSHDRPITEQYEEMQQTNVKPSIRLLHYIAALPLPRFTGAGLSTDHLPAEIIWTMEAMYELQLSFNKEWLSDKAFSISKTAYGREIASIVKDRCPGADALSSGIVQSRTSAARGYKINRPQLLAFVQKRHGVSSTAVYLDNMSIDRLTRPGFGLNVQGEWYSRPHSYND